MNPGIPNQSGRLFWQAPAEPSFGSSHAADARRTNEGGIARWPTLL